MSDLVTFLRARLDEDEAAARESFYEGQRWLTEEEGVYRWPDDELVHHADRKADARHIARHDPARVLREVAAGRAILALHRPELWNADDDPDDIHCAECTADEDLYKAQIWPCPTVRHLAAVYSDHPDYDEEWKP